MKYVYKNEVGRPINIGGFQFSKDQELPSDIIIERFKEAVSNGFLSLNETKVSVPVASDKDDQEEAKKAAEAARIEAERLKAEEAKKAEDARLAEEAKKAEEAEKIRIAEEAKKAEEARLAHEEEAKKAAEATKKK